MAWRMTWRYWSRWTGCKVSMLRLQWCSMVWWRMAFLRALLESSGRSGWRRMSFDSKIWKRKNVPPEGNYELRKQQKGRRKTLWTQSLLGTRFNESQISGVMAHQQRLDSPKPPLKLGVADRYIPRNSQLLGEEYRTNYEGESSSQHIPAAARIAGKLSRSTLGIWKRSRAKGGLDFFYCPNSSKRRVFKINALIKLIPDLEPH